MKDPSTKGKQMCRLTNAGDVHGSRQDMMQCVLTSGEGTKSSDL